MQKFLAYANSSTLLVSRVLILKMLQGLGETFGRVTIEAMAFGLPV